MNKVLIIFISLLSIIAIVLMAIFTLVLLKWNKNRKIETIKKIINDSYFMELQELKSKFRQLQSINKKTISEKKFKSQFHDFKIIYNKLHENSEKAEELKKDILATNLEEKKHQEFEKRLKELKLEFKMIEQTYKNMFQEILESHDIYREANKRLTEHFPIAIKELENDNLGGFKPFRKIISTLIQEINDETKDLKENALKHDFEHNLKKFNNLKSKIKFFYQIINYSREVKVELDTNIPNKTQILIKFYREEALKNPNLEKLIDINEFKNNIAIKWNKIKKMSLVHNYENIDQLIREIYIEMFSFQTKINEEILAFLFLKNTKKEIIEKTTIVFKKYRNILNYKKINKDFFNRIEEIESNIQEIKTMDVYNEEHSYKMQLFELKRYLIHLNEINKNIDKINKDIYWRNYNIEKINRDYKKAEFYFVKIFLDLKQFFITFNDETEIKINEIEKIRHEINNFKGDNQEELLNKKQQFINFFSPKNKIVLDYARREILNQLFEYLNSLRALNTKLNAVLRIVEKEYSELKFEESLSRIVAWLEKEGK